jgi:hypothetical protein
MRLQMWFISSRIVDMHERLKGEDQNILILLHTLSNIYCRKGCWRYSSTEVEYLGAVSILIPFPLFNYIQCSLCRLIRHPEHLFGRHWYLPANWRSFIRWSPDQCVSQCYAIRCDRSFYFALFCVFMTCVSQCPVSLHPEHILISYVGLVVLTAVVMKSSVLWDILLCSELTFWRNMSTKLSGSKNKPSKKSAWRRQQALLAIACF